MAGKGSRSRSSFGLESVRAHCLSNIGVARACLGDLGGLEDLQLAFEVALAAHDGWAAWRARANLADTYHLAHKLKDALPLYERTFADRERVQGPDHPDTITACGSLASAYHSARKLTMALPLYERTLADCERVHGADHRDTLASLGNLAHAYHTAGRLTEALTVFERTLAECERVLGPGHPLTETARENYQAAAQG